MLVFLLPLFFWGFANVLNFPKQGLLILFCVLALFLWFLNGVSKGSFKIRFSFLDFLILGFLLVLAISTIFSRWTWGSFWGWPQDTASSFLTISFLAIFYFLIINLFEEKKEIFLLQLFLLASAFFVASIGILQLFGKFFLPFDFTKINSFNTIGTFNSWGVFLAGLVPLAIALIFNTKGLIRIILGILALPVFLGIIFLNYWIVWLGILFSMIVFLIFGISRFGKISPKFLILIMLLFSVSLFFGVFRVSIPGLPTTPLEVSPSYKATFNVSYQMIGSSLKDLILGWGPGTFKYGWSKYKSALLNQTIFWNVRFTKGACEVLEILGERGILGTISFLALICFSFYLGFSELLKSKKIGGELVFSLAPFAGLIGLSAIKFLYPGNVSLSFLWWFFLAIFMAELPKREKVFTFKPDSRASFLISFVLILIFILGVVLFYFEGQRFLAERKYNLSFTSLIAGEQDRAIILISEAIRQNQQQEIFWRDLAQIYLGRAQAEMLRTDISDEEKTLNVGNFVAGAVNAAKRATEINPENVANWQIRGLIYRSIIGWSQGAFDWALTSYERALELEPTNPFIYVELGRIYIAQANLIPGPEVTTNLEKAEDHIRKAIELKGDYALAYYQQALIYELRGKSEEAITTLEGVKQMATFLPVYNPLLDVGLAFQLGVLYYRQEDFNKAQAELERAVELSPAYSNARYFLGLIYDRKGKTQEAIKQFETIAGLNPENQEVKKILSNLKAGKPALEGIITTPETIPIEEKPEEK